MAPSGSTICAQDRYEEPVHLYGSDLGAGLDKGEGERAEAGPDLDDLLARDDLGEAGDAADGVGIAYEILAQGAARREAVELEQGTDLSVGMSHLVPGDLHPHQTGGWVREVAERVLRQIEDAALYIRATVADFAGDLTRPC